MTTHRVRGQVTATRNAAWAPAARANVWFCSNPGSLAPDRTRAAPNAGSGRGAGAAGAFVGCHSVCEGEFRRRHSRPRRTLHIIQFSQLTRAVCPGRLRLVAWWHGADGLAGVQVVLSLDGDSQSQYQPALVAAAPSSTAVCSSDAHAAEEQGWVAATPMSSLSDSRSIVR